MTEIDSFDAHDIVDGLTPGGANTSGTMLLPMLQRLMSSVPAAASFEDFERQAIEYNLLGRDTFEGRRRSFRALREMYLLDRDRILFRALRDLWEEDPSTQPLLAGLCVLARDSSFRATSELVLKAKPGEHLANSMMADTLGAAFPGYSRPSTEKIGRNTAASWGQTGHLVGRTDKCRTLVTPTPVAMSYALLLGHLQGLRGTPLFSSLWVDFLDVPAAHREAMASDAARKGYLEYKSAGNVVEVGFRHLLRPMRVNE